MYTKFKSIFSIYLFSFSSITFFLLSSCNKNKCKEEILADLKTADGDSLHVTITDNNLLILSHRFINDGTTNIDADESCICKVNTTNPHIARWKLYYFEEFSDTLPSNMEADTIVDVMKPPLAACQKDTTSISVQLLSTGLYVIECILDAENETLERDELNNIVEKSNLKPPSTALALMNEKTNNNFTRRLIRVKISHEPKMANQLFF
jgi:hypothetical protein